MVFLVKNLHLYASPIEQYFPFLPEEYTPLCKSIVMIFLNRIIFIFVQGHFNDFFHMENIHLYATPIYLYFSIKLYSPLCFFTWRIYTSAKVWIIDVITWRIHTSLSYFQLKNIYPYILQFQPEEYTPLCEPIVMIF